MRHVIITLALLLLALTARGAKWDDVVPRTSAVLDGYSDVDSLKARLQAAPLRHLEGLWRFAGDQALVAIELCDATSEALPGMELYRLVIVDSPRKAVKPGTVLGYAVPAGQRDTYDARLYTSWLRSLLKNHARFTMKIDADDSHLTLTPVKSSWKLLLRHTFHFLVRAGLYHNPQASQAVEGFTRVFPPSTGRPAQPIYL